jgi:ABC-2 type transport system ATP-binding protein
MAHDGGRVGGAVAAVVVALLLAGCAGTTTTTPTAATTNGRDTATTATATACAPPSAAPPATTPVDGVASDFDLTSFDGTRIRVHWFPNPSASGHQPAPTVLMGPGWGLPGDTNVSAVGVLGVLNIASLQRAGYNVVTWDPRGFGKSDGTIEVDSIDFEARDVQRIIDWVGTQPEARLDRPGDPRVGMIGGSYGGGIQLVSAALDCRIDAIVPVIAWHSLVSSLYKADTYKAGWSNLLTKVATGRSLDPHITDATASATSTATISADDKQWFASLGPDNVLDRINIPTLFIQGTVDTLFTLDEAIQNYQALRDRGVPTGMVWFCGGHGTCLTSPGDPDVVNQAGITWLQRYLTGDQSVDTGRRIDLIDQNGKRYGMDDYPPKLTAPLNGDGQGNLALTADGGSGPTTMGPAHAGVVDNLVLGITPAKATNAVDVPIQTGPAVHAVGAPQLTLSYTGTPGQGDAPTRVFAQLVDTANDLVVGNQVTPIQVTLDGQHHDVTVPMETISFTTGGLQLQLVATTVAYAQPQLGGSVTFDKIHVAIPVAQS